MEKSDSNIKIIVLAGLLSAMTFISTYAIRIPAILGYIHPGDAFVLLCGLLLGPLWGSLCAGFGSAMSDLVGGYMVFVPATFIIKAGCAAIIAIICANKKTAPVLAAGGILAELFMVLGYFIFEAFLMGGDAGLAAATSGIPFNLIQGAFGVIAATIVYPIISRIIKA